MKRFRSASFRGEDPTLVQVELFRTRLETETPGNDPKNLWDLSASAQTQLIQILHERYDDNGQFTAALNQSFPGNRVPEALDLSSADLRLVFTVSKYRDYVELGKNGGKYSPADRIQYLKISLELPSDVNLHFRDWNRYETEYGELDIGDVSFSRELELDAQATGEFARGGMNTSSGRRENQALRTRVMRLNGRLSDTLLVLEEEGDRATDLTGNIVADVLLEFDSFPERIALPDPGFKDGNPVLTGLAFRDLIIPRMEHAPETVYGKLVVEYIYRHVESGWKTYQEWDDKVSFYRGKVEKEVPVLVKTDYTPEIFGIGSFGGNSDLPERVLRIRTAGGEEFPLRFLGLADAHGFLDRFIRVPGTIENHSESPLMIGSDMVFLGDRVLTGHSISEIQGLRVFPVY